MSTDEFRLMPKRDTPMRYMVTSVSRPRILPAAFTLMADPTNEVMSCTTSRVAPLGAQPVAVFTKAAPALMHSSQARFSSSRSR